MNKVISYLKEVGLQMKKINWPTVREALRYTLIVIFISVVLAIFLGGIDFGLTALLNKLINR
jgi:preprotein translocase subunit SecE